MIATHGLWIFAAASVANNHAEAGKTIKMFQ